MLRINSIKSHLNSDDRYFVILSDGFLILALSEHMFMRHYSGLPHAHILLFLGNEDKPQSPELVDCLVSAEIPDIATNPKLFDVITRCNIHGPCGSINTNSPCMQGEGQSGCCSKSFPKPFASRTLFCDISYPVPSVSSQISHGGRAHLHNEGSRGTKLSSR